MVADLAKSVRARLRVDRAYLSPVLEQTEKPRHMLEHAEDVGDEEFAAALRSAVERSWDDVEVVMTQWRLNDFLDRFASAAADVIQQDQVVGPSTSVTRQPPLQPGSPRSGVRGYRLARVTPPVLGHRSLDLAWSRSPTWYAVERPCEPRALRSCWAFTGTSLTIIEWLCVRTYG